MSTANVLWVDDEVTIVKTFSERLVMRILNISKAVDGEEAIQVREANYTVHGNSFDLVSQNHFFQTDIFTAFKKRCHHQPAYLLFLSLISEINPLANFQIIS